MKRVLLVPALSFLLFATARAEDPVYFQDANLKAAVENELWIPDPTPTDMLGLTSLNAGGRRIQNLTGLEYATNLQTLSIRWNQVSDISILGGLTNLEYLDAHDNQIASLSSLSGLTYLETIILRYNQVSDISALAALTSLQHVDLRANPLNEAACDTYIARILANNPGVQLEYDSCGMRCLAISSTAGGSVIAPGEGEFTYDNGAALWVEAKADPGFVFINWSGSVAGTNNPMFITMDQDQQVKANFVSGLDVLYVDDDAPEDPGPGDATLSDPHENGTPEHPFDKIQEAIDAATKGLSVIVRPGRYHENISLLGKSIQLIGIDPNDPNGTAYPVIDGAGTGPVVSFTRSEDPSCLLTGFVITRGEGQRAAAIHCSGSSPTIANCLIVGNRSTGPDGGAVYCTDSEAVFANCTIADNYAGERGAGIALVDSEVVLIDSILWGNTPTQVLFDGARIPSINYCDIADGWLGRLTIIDDDPAFAQVGYWADPGDLSVALAPGDPNAVWVAGDYHLKSQAGRWDPVTRTWVQDMVTSPCIDAGDPASPVGQEPLPHGDMINMGAYGGTAQASRSVAGP